MAEQTHTLHLDALHCGACAARTEAAVSALDGVTAAHVNLATATVGITTQNARPLGDILTALDAAGTPARRNTHNFTIEAMHCGSCAARIEKALSEVPMVLSAQANPAMKTATVTVLAGGPDATALAVHLEQAGYPAQTEEAPQPAPRDEGADLRRATWTAAALSLPVVVLEMGGHLIPSFHHWTLANLGQQTSWLIQFVFTTLILLWPGARFFRLGVPALLRRAPDMNALVALGTSAAWGFSTVALFAPNVLPPGARAVYFEAAAVIVTLILLGRTLEARAKGQTGTAIRKLITLRPKTATVIEGDKAIERPVAELRVGDLLRVRPGDAIPTDANVETGTSFVNEAMLTGEPAAVAKGPGDPVTGGTLNGAGALEIRATAVGDATALAQIIRLVSQAQAARLPIQELVNRVTLWFVPTVMAIATLTVLMWLILGPPPTLGFALVAGVSVLIIACPCAMGLATPTSIMVGTGRAAELGVLFRKGDALQSLQATRLIAFDKTGTLTEGRPAVTQLQVAPDHAADVILRLAASAEARSEHPIAHAILDHAAASDIAPAPHADVQAIPGYGLEAQVNGQSVLLGSARLLERTNIAIPDALRVQDEKTPVYMAVDGRFAATFSVSDPIKRGAKAAIAALHAKGLRTALVTGDTRAVADAVARELGLDTVIADVRPDQKAQQIKALQAHGPVAFVGDGINDAPALATADIGIAIGTGTDVAIEAADVVLMSGALDGVVNAFDISRKTLANIRQNLVWAFGYNVLLIPVAAGALYPATGMMLSPILAAGAMTLSSLFVLGNALRLRFAAAPARPADPDQPALKKIPA
ncbi:MAG: heavy metal translocating P-type ATPase [Pseudomonadota bacterium]